MSLKNRKAAGNGITQNLRTRERPIIFSAPMVRAIVDGRKSQTRRVVKWNNHAGVNLNFSGLSLDSSAPGCAELYTRDGDARWQERANARCPYGKPGDRLWVREAWYPDAPCDGMWADTEYYGCKNARLDLIPKKYRKPEHVLYRSNWNGVDLRWKPSIYMPRWASRLTLEITDVRVQRLQEISVEDSLAEGITHSTLNDPRVEYQWLWESINGEGSWAANPWVWALTFPAAAPEHRTEQERSEEA